METEQFPRAGFGLQEEAAASLTLTVTFTFCFRSLRLFVRLKFSFGDHPAPSGYATVFLNDSNHKG